MSEAGAEQAGPSGSESGNAGWAIDVHAHAFPEEVLREFQRLAPDQVRISHSRGKLVAVWAGAPLPAFDPAQRLGEMDRDRVRLEVLSAPVVYGLREGAAALCVRLNDYQAELARLHPERFRSFLHLPVHEPDVALAELRRWRDAPQVAGVTLGSNALGLYPGDRSLDALWAEISALNMPVFLHPVKPSVCFGPLAPPLLLFPTDTAVAAASIIYAGLFERHPGLCVILSHYGGALPMLARRLDMAAEVEGFPPGHGQELPRLPSEYVGNFYVDTAQGYHRAAFDCARAVFGLNKMLYGSDHFFEGSSWRPALNRFLSSLDLTPDEATALVRGNAARVLRGLSPETVC